MEAKRAAPQAEDCVRQTQTAAITSSTNTSDQDLLTVGTSAMSNCRRLSLHVLSSRDKTSYSKDASALEKVLKTLAYLEPKSDQVLTSAASVPPMAATPNRFASLADAVAEAERLSETEEGKLYDFDVNATLSNRLGVTVGQCAKDSKPLIFDLVFVFASDGHVAQVFQPPDSTVAACVASKLSDLRLRAPPQPDWPVQIHVELNTRVKAKRLMRRATREPAITKIENCQWAGRAEMNKNCEVAPRREGDQGKRKFCALRLSEPRHALP